MIVNNNTIKFSSLEIRESTPSLKNLKSMSAYDLSRLPKEARARDDVKIRAQHLARNEDLNALDVRFLLTVDPTLTEVGVVNAIGNMNIVDLSELPKEAHGRDDVKARAQQLADGLEDSRDSIYFPHYLIMVNPELKSRNAFFNAGISHCINSEHASRTTILRFRKNFFDREDIQPQLNQKLMQHDYQKILATTAQNPPEADEEKVFVIQSNAQNLLMRVAHQHGLESLCSEAKNFVTQFLNSKIETQKAAEIINFFPSLAGHAGIKNALGCMSWQEMKALPQEHPDVSAFRADFIKAIESLKVGASIKDLRGCLSGAYKSKLTQAALI